ncbi:MAG: hypothetical protein K5899_02040 [Bacteroidaceae bacterium]|nr:hypothetical protein [Bacteroidaceae bacterium]
MVIDDDCKLVFDGFRRLQPHLVSGTPVAAGDGTVWFSERLLPLAMAPSDFQNACCRWRWRRPDFGMPVAVGDGGSAAGMALQPLAMAALRLVALVSPRYAGGSSVGLFIMTKYLY